MTSQNKFNFLNLWDERNSEMDKANSLVMEINVANAGAVLNVPVPGKI